MGVAGKIFFEGFMELSEHSVDSESIQKIERVLSEEKEISSWHALQTRRLGAELFIDVHVLVDPKLSLVESHDISIKIEKKVKQRLSKPVNVLVHIEPSMRERKE